MILFFFDRICNQRAEGRQLPLKHQDGSFQFSSFAMKPRPTNGGRRPVSHGCQMLSHHFRHLWRFVIYIFPREIAEVSRSWSKHEFPFLAGTVSTNWRLAFFRYWKLNKWTIPMHNWLRSMAGATIGRFGMVTGLSLEVQGPSPYPSHPGVSNCLGMFGACAGIFQDLVLLLFSRVFCFWINTFLETWWCFDSCLTAISTQNSYQSDEWDLDQLDLPCHQFVFWTHLRLRQWRCSRLCWCPACKEALVSGKWFAHWQCILCWQRPIVFTVWWINPVDRLTCHRWDTLRNNILKQLFCNQPDITWNRFPSTPGEVQNLSCQKIERCTKQMKRMHVRNANDHGKLDAQTSQAGFLQQQCYCKHSTHEEIRESVRVNYWVQSHHPARTSSGWMFELWISDGFEWFFAVSFVYPKFAVLARSKQLMLMPVTVKFRLDFLVSGLQGRLSRHLARVDLMFPCNKGHEVMKIAEIEILASVGWKCCRQNFSCPCSQNVTHCQKEICSAWWLHHACKR